MKKLKLIFYLLILVLGALSCGEDPKIKLISDSLFNIDPALNTFDAIVVIPNEGCGGCINDATHFMIENIDSLKLRTAVIFTEIQDLKSFKIRIENKFIAREDVILDLKNSFGHFEISSIYPQYILLKNDKVTSIELFNEIELN